MNQEFTRLAILGIGDPKYGPAIVATLAHVFGERPLLISVWDRREDLRETMYLLGQTCLAANRTPHHLHAYEEMDWALDRADAVLVVGAVPDFAVPDGTPVLHVGDESAPPFGTHLDWAVPSPPEPTSTWGLQILRWMRGEESIWPLMHQYERTPLRDWLVEEVAGKRH